MATLELQNVTKNFGSTEVIHGIDIRIADGEFIVIVGLLTVVQFKYIEKRVHY